MCLQCLCLSYLITMLLMHVFFTNNVYTNLLDGYVFFAKSL